MAFSTQKEFFHVPFMNETVDYECRRACVKLKTYQSTIDDRSWAMDESLQSRFLSDLVTCQTPVGGFGVGDGDDQDDYEDDASGQRGHSMPRHMAHGGDGRRGPGRAGTGRGDDGHGGGVRGGDGRGGGGVGRVDARAARPGDTAGGRTKRAADESGYVAGTGMGGDVGAGPSGRGGAGAGGLGTGRSGGFPGEVDGGRGGGGPGGGPGGGAGGASGSAGGKQGQGSLFTADSVLACANEHLGRFQDLLLNKKQLEKQLELSNERLKVANMENEKIKAIMNDKFDSNHAKDFYNKIQKLTSSGKISKGEENELLQIYNKFEDMNKAYEVLQAENAYLKRLMEKLSLRASYDVIKTEPEKSNDITFLQNEVNKLRKEVSILRSLEDEKLQGRVDSNRSKMSDQDAEALKAIIKERNALREKCKTFKDLESKVYELQKIAKEADKMSDSLSNDLDGQSKHIVRMEHEMKQMQEYYEDQMAKLKFNEELLKCQLNEMKEDLIRTTCKAQKAEYLRMENGCLHNELKRRDIALNDYDCQYKQLMNVIDELQHNAIQNLHDTQTQTCTDYMDDLTFFARATLSEIKKELNKRGGDGDKIMRGGIFGGNAITDGLSPEECCAELRRLQDGVKQLTKQNEMLQNNVKQVAEDLCADALKKLQDMEEKYNKAQDYIANLKKDKDDLNMRAMDKLNEFSTRVDKLDSDVGKTAKETAGMDKDLKESMKLVKDISDIQLKNAELTNAVHAITTRDDEKTMDDLRRQLLEEQAKNNKCQEENKNLQETLIKGGIDPVLAKKGILKETTDAEGEKVGERKKREAAADRDAQKGGPGTVQDAQRGGPSADQDAQRGGPGAGPYAQRDGPGADREVQRGGPGVGQDAQRKGPGADQDPQRGGPGTGPDAQKGRGPEQVRPSEVRDGAPGADQKGGPGAGREGGPDADEKYGPGVGKDGAPGAGRRDGPGAGREGGPDAGQKGGPEADRVGGTEIGRKDGTGAGKEGEPDAGQKGGPDGGKKDLLGPGEGGSPDAAQKDGPDADRKAGPDADRKDGPDVGEGGGKMGVPGVGEDGVPGTGGPDAGGPGAGRPGIVDPGTGGPGTGGPGTGGPGVGSPGAGPAAGAERSGADGTAGPTGDGSAVGGDGADDGVRRAGYQIGTGKGDGVGGGAPGRGPHRGGPLSVGGKGRKGKISDGPADDAFQEFIDTNANTMITNIRAGSALEKELRAILNAFMMECGFCFCKSLVPKSKFYALCHKLLHNGIQCMAFRELAYMHRKVFMAADKLHPGCLINMILTEQGYKDGEGFKCCHCKNALCCSNSEEMLKEKVCKLERDIEMAKEYLDSLRAQPRSPKSPYTTRGKTYRQMEDSYSEAVEELLTCRETKPVLSKTQSKQMKTLKARIMKCSELLR